MVLTVYTGALFPKVPRDLWSTSLAQISGIKMQITIMCYKERELGLTEANKEASPCEKGHDTESGISLLQVENWYEFG